MNFLEDRFEDYFEDQSEAEQIIEAAAEKLVGLISEKTKAGIERYKNWYESSDKMRVELQKESYEQREKIKVLEIELSKVRKELERRDNEISKVPFMPGEKVYWVGNDCPNTVTIKCSTCNGNGKVKTQTTDYGEVEITCPHCKGKKCVTYEPAKAYSGYIVESNIALKVTDDTPSFIYRLVDNESDLKRFKNNEEKYAFTRSEIYKTKDEAKAVADQETEKRKFEAEKNLYPDNK